MIKRRDVICKVRAVHSGSLQYNQTFLDDLKGRWSVLAAPCDGAANKLAWSGHLPFFILLNAIHTKSCSEWVERQAVTCAHWVVGWSVEEWELPAIGINRINRTCSVCVRVCSVCSCARDVRDVCDLCDTRKGTALQWNYPKSTWSTCRRMHRNIKQLC
jgi:hypothetical protein